MENSQKSFDCVAMERLNAECFTDADEFSQKGAIRNYVDRGGLYGIVAAEHAPLHIVGYWLARPADHSGIGKLERYGVAQTYRGQGFSNSLLKDFWQQVPFATTYVAATNPDSLHALITAGFRYFTSDGDFIYLVGASKHYKIVKLKVQT